ncbi:high-affinity zinc uptake system znuA domain protein, partial [Glaesserella parasuis SW114]
MFKKSLLSLALLGATAVTNADVLTTVKPLGFIANAITDGVTETKVLLPTSASPHDYSLKPSDVEQLQSAQLVVWIGEEMETFLEKSIEKLPKEKVLTLEDVPAIKELVEHSGEEKEEHHEHKHGHSHNHTHHAHSHDGHNHDEDWHIWLSPQASEHIAEQIAERLSQ